MNMRQFLLCSLLCFQAIISSGQYEFTVEQDARNYAHEKGMDILIIFAGSDWCKPCILFKNRIIDSEEFREYARKFLAILYLDFPMKKENRLSAVQTEQNELLAEKYNPEGAFPWLVLTDHRMHEKQRFRPDNQMLPADFIELLNRMNKGNTNH